MQIRNKHELENFKLKYNLLVLFILEIEFSALWNVKNKYLRLTGRLAEYISTQLKSKFSI